MDFFIHCTLALIKILLDLLMHLQQKMVKMTAPADELGKHPLVELQQSNKTRYEGDARLPVTASC